MNNIMNNTLDTNDLAGSFDEGGPSDNMAVAKYNSRSNDDDIQRINSP